MSDHIKCLKKLMLPILTFIVLIGMSCTVRITRSMANAEIMPEAVPAYSVKYKADSGFSKAEAGILGLLTADHIPKQDNDTYRIYTQYLADFFRSSGMELSNSKVDLINEKIMEITQVFHQEKNSNFQEMTIDGRIIATDIANKIYNLCGLNLQTNADGVIIRITNDHGDILYRKEIQVQADAIHSLALLTIVCIITALYLLLFIIERRKRNYKKEVKYHGFDEKKYA